MKKETLAVALALMGMMGSASADDTYPNRAITIVVGFPPGGSADNVARIFADGLSKEVGQPVVVENRPGAGTTIGASRVARAAPDGYTVFLGTASVMGGDQRLYKVDYTPSDFIPVSRVTVAPLLLIVNSKTGITSVSELIAAAKAQPGTLNYSSSGSGVITHLAGVQFSRMADIRMVHVPYKGGAPSVQAVSAGDVQLSFATVSSALAGIGGERAKALGVTSAERSPLLQDIPSIAEQGVKGFDVTSWFGLFLPAKTPDAVVQRLFSATKNSLQDNDIKTKLAHAAEEVSTSESPQEFKAFAEREGKVYVDLIVASGAGVD